MFQRKTCKKKAGLKNVTGGYLHDRELFEEFTEFLFDFWNKLTRFSFGEST